MTIDETFERMLAGSSIQKMGFASEEAALEFDQQEAQNGVRTSVVRHARVTTGYARVTVHDPFSLRPEDELGIVASELAIQFRSKALHGLFRFPEPDSPVDPRSARAEIMTAAALLPGGHASLCVLTPRLYNTLASDHRFDWDPVLGKVRADSSLSLDAPAERYLVWPHGTSPGWCVLDKQKSKRDWNPERRNYAIHWRSGIIAPHWCGFGAIDLRT